MPQNWTPQPWTPQPWGDFGGDQPRQYGTLPQLPVTNYPQPTPGVEPSPYVPDNPGDVIDTRPGFGPGVGGYRGPGGSPGINLPFMGGYSGPGQPINWRRTGAGFLGSLLGGPAGGILAKVLYDEFGFRQRDPLEMMEIFGTNYEEMGARRNPMQSRQREGSTRFSQGEMDLSNLPMYGAPGSLMPAVFAGERGSAMPGGGQAPMVEQR